MQSHLLCGFHAVLEALSAHPESIDHVWLSDTRHDARANDVIAKARDAGIKVQKVPHKKLDELAGEVKHQGVVARGRLQPRRDLDELLAALAEVKGAPLLLVLDGVLDPHNLGACLRS